MKAVFNANFLRRLRNPRTSVFFRKAAFIDAHTVSVGPLGVHVIGELATELVHTGLIAMMTDATPEIFIEASFNVPTLGMLYKTATLADHR